MNNTSYSTGKSPVLKVYGWMCFVVGGGAPTFVHPTMEKAVKEAERLSKLKPGCEVRLLAIMGTCVTQSPTIWK